MSQGYSFTQTISDTRLLATLYDECRARGVRAQTVVNEALAARYSAAREPCLRCAAYVEELERLHATIARIAPASVAIQQPVLQRDTLGDGW